MSGESQEVKVLVYHLPGGKFYTIDDIPFGNAGTFDHTHSTVAGQGGSLTVGAGGAASTDTDGTAGRVFFVGADGGLQGSADLFWNDAQNYLGIRGEPGTHLDVWDTGGGIARVSRNDAAVTNNEVFGQYQFWSNDSSLVASNVAATVQARSDGTQIGTHPSGKLEFYTANITTGLELAMVIDRNSDIAIGLDDPGDAKVHIASEATSGDLMRLQASNNTSFADVVMRFYRTRGTIGTPTAVQDGDEVGTFIFSVNDGGAAVEDCARFGAVVDGVVAANDTPGALFFSTTPAGSETSVERMRIHPDGSVVINDSGISTADFRWESDSQTHAIFGNAGTDRVSIGGNVSVPLGTLHVHNPNASSSAPVLWMEQADVSEQMIHVLATGGDQDIRILTVGVDDPNFPEFSWLETANVFNLSHGLTVETGIVTITNTGLHLLDTDASHDLVIRPGSNLTADRTLSLTTGDVDRTITLTGSPTLDNWFNQNVKTNASPTFSGVTVSGLLPSTVVYSGAAKALTSLANGGGYLTNDGAGALSWSAGAIPAAHAATHANGGSDAVDHDTLVNFFANEHIDHTTITLTAGDGLTGGGTIAANRTFNLDTPGTLSVTSTDVAAGNHTHAITTTADGETNPSTILRANASGRIRLSAIGIGVATGAANQITIVDGGTIGKAGGPLLTFNDTSNFLTLAGAWAGFGTATPLGQIDAMQAGSQFSLIVGADVSAQSRTNATRKFARVAMPHFTNAEEPFSLLVGDSDGSGNILSVGGGTSVANAATSIIFYTAASDTTITGTARARITSAGRLAVGVTAPLARAHFDQFDSGAGVPALLLDQGDVSEQCIKFSSDGVDRDIHLFTVGVTGAPGMDWDESQDAIDFINMSGITVEAGSFYGWGDQTVRIEGHDTNDTMGLYTGNALVVSIDNSQSVAIGQTATGSSLLTLLSSGAGARPCVEMIQQTVTEEFIRLRGTASAGALTRSIVDEGDQASETREGWVKVHVTDDGGQIVDQAYYVPIYTLSE